MIFGGKQIEEKFLRRIFLLTAVLVGLAFIPSYSAAQLVSNLPRPGETVSVSPKYEPAVLVGITVNPVNPLLFDFIVDRADSQLKGAELEEESQKLIKYFLAALTIPEDEVWVNLSPYEDDFVIPNALGSTEMGRDMLAQDYLLKQISASLTHPDNELGKLFWKKVYTKAYELYGLTELPVNTFNKVWITSGEALVLQQDGSAFVAESHLKVMLEGDYISTRANLENKDLGTDQLDSQDVEEISDLSSSIIKEIVVPELQKEVNEGRNFAVVRQIYNAVILATWYKKNLRETLLGRVYVNKNKIGGIELADEEINDLIYNQYLEAFRRGVYSLIREDYDPLTQGRLSRRYFSGGLVFDDDLVTVRRVDPSQSFADLPPIARQRIERVQNVLRQTASPDSTDDDARYVRVRALGTERLETGFRLTEEREDEVIVGDVARLTDDIEQGQRSIEQEDLSYDARRNEDTVRIPDNVTVYYQEQELQPNLADARFMLENVRIEAPPEGSYGIYLEEGSGIFNSIIRFSQGGLQNLRLTRKSIIMDSEISGGIAFQGEQVRLQRVIHAPEETKTYDYAVDANGKRTETLRAIEVLEAPAGETTITLLQEQEDGSIQNIVVRGSQQIEAIKPAAVVSLQRQQLQRVRSAYNASELPALVVPSSTASLPQESIVPKAASELTKALPKGVDQYGGIDFNPDMLNLQIKRNGKGIPLPLESQNMDQINIDGIYPVILEIAPATFTNFPFLLGTSQEEVLPQLSQN